jgi:hypothetical protein
MQLLALNDAVSDSTLFIRKNDQAPELVEPRRIAIVLLLTATAKPDLRPGDLGRTPRIAQVVARNLLPRECPDGSLRLGLIQALGLVIAAAPGERKNGESDESE